MLLLLHSAPSSLRILLLLAFAALNASARDCNFLPYNTAAALARSTVSSQDDVKTLFGDCATISGTVYIAANYMGSLSLPNVTSISDGIVAGYGVTPYLTSIEAPDLTAMDRIYVNNASSLASVSFPLLAGAMSEIHLEAIGPSAILDFPAVATVDGDVTISGPVSRFNFQALTSINGTLFVSGRSEIFLSGKYSPVIYRGALPALNVSFEALETALSVVVKGSIWGLYMPQLSTITDTPNGDNYGFVVSTFGNPLYLDMPSLSDVTQVMLGGTFSAISFPSLLRTERFEVFSADPLDVELGTLESVDTFTVDGNITGLSLPALTSVNTLKAYTSLSMDCTAAAAAWERANHTLADDGYRCEGTMHAHRKMVLGVAIAVPIAVVALCVAAYFCWRRRRATRNSKTVKPPPNYEIETLPKYAPDEPPTYAPGSRGAGEGAVAAEDVDAGGRARDEGPAAGRNGAV